MAKTSVSLLAIPDAMMSTLSGLHDVLNGFELLSGFDDAVPAEPPFDARVVAPDGQQLTTASGFPLRANATLAETPSPDVVIIPSLLVPGRAWVPGRYPEVVEWLRAVEREGALVCSACSGVLLLAETGLLDGRDATVHFAYAETFRRNFPRVNLRIEETLVASGDRAQFIMSGASASWTDLALYLIARVVGTTAAQAIANFMLLQWHTEGQAPYIPFAPPVDHGDAAIFAIQQWLAAHYALPNPVEAMTEHSGLPERTFKRRFAKATGFTPIDYVQRLRIEKAKRLLERTDVPVDEVGFQAGYIEPAAFRRLFKRITNLTPGEYRRRFRTPFISTLHS